MSRIRDIYIYKEYSLSLNPLFFIKADIALTAAMRAPAEGDSPSRPDVEASRPPAGRPDEDPPRQPPVSLFFKTKQNSHTRR